MLRTDDGFAVKGGGETVVAPEPMLPRMRWILLTLLFLITVINFIDRQTLSVLAPVIRHIFHLSNERYGRIVAALQFGMMTGEVPMGYLMDRWGTQIGISVAVLWWSMATGAQIFARSGEVLASIRFWMGTGECGGFSGGIKTVARVFPKKERTLAIGIFNSGSVIGATIAPPLIVFLLERYGFRAAFLVPAVLGVIWLPFWWFAHRGIARTARIKADVPAEQTASSLRSMLRDSSSWAVMGCRFFIGPVMQFYWYWTPNYLYNARHMSMIEIGAFSWIPFLFGDLGGVLGGWAAGAMIGRGVRIGRVRKVLMYLSSLLCMASFFVPYASGWWMALGVIAIAVFADNFLSANMFGAIADLFPDSKVGRATGLTGLAGGFSGLLLPLLTGYLIDRVSYRPAFAIVALLPLVGTVSLFALGRRYRDLDAGNGGAAVAVRAGNHA
jgi:ACS family hexuronate transporter-like MFS transporter